MREEHETLECLWWERVFAKASKLFTGYMVFTLLVDGNARVTFDGNQYHYHDHFDCLSFTGGDLDVRPATQAECDEISAGWAQIAATLPTDRQVSISRRSDA